MAIAALALGMAVVAGCLLLLSLSQAAYAAGRACTPHRQGVFASLGASLCWDFAFHCHLAAGAPAFLAQANVRQDFVGLGSAGLGAFVVLCRRESQRRTALLALFFHEYMPFIILLLTLIYLVGRGTDLFTRQWYTCFQLCAFGSRYRAGEFCRNDWSFYAFDTPDATG